MISNLVITVLMCFVISCSSIVSIEEYTKYWIGRNIEEKRKVVSDSGSYGDTPGCKIDDGKRVYVEKDSPDCFILWEVNERGMIVGYTLKGDRCHSGGNRGKYPLFNQ